MVFSSLVFAFFFLPVTLGIYYMAKENYRNYILLIASILFYSYGEPRFVFVMLASIVINYGLAIHISDNKIIGRTNVAKGLLIVDIVINLGILFVCKYLDFSISIFNKLFKTDLHILGIVLPAGISFFTFQALSYVIDVYRGTVDVQKNLFNLALYISFFPQLIAGPIVRYTTISTQITSRKITIDRFADGIRRFFLGFSKKVFLANNLSLASNEVFMLNPTETNPVILWVGSICYSLQIFYDFSGYSDMAIGLGKMFGFDFEENFDYPYISKSVTEFWRRWHISLGRWFRDYVYIPLGGSKVPFFKHLVNMFVVWILTGIWHGANYTFIAWGLGYFVLLVFEKYIVKPEKQKRMPIRIIWQIITLNCVNFGWVIFNSSGIHQGLMYCKGMMGFYDISFVIDTSVIRYIREYGFFLLCGILFSTPIVRILRKKIEQTKADRVFAVIIPIVYGFLFLISVSYLILGAHNPFIYFNF